MKQRNIERKLMQYYVPDYDEKVMHNTIDTIHRMKIDFPQARMKQIEFIITQIRFIRKRIWAAHLFVLILFGYFLFTNKIIIDFNFNEIAVLSIAMPLMVLCSLSDFTKAAYHNMVEIEFTTRNSLSKVLSAKMLIFGVLDMLIFTVLVAVANRTTSVDLLQLIIYGLVPFNLICIGCMEIMKRSYGSKVNMYCLIYGCTLMLIILMGGTVKYNLYTVDYFNIWIIVFLFSSILFIYKIKWLKKSVKCFDDVMS